MATRWKIDPKTRRPRAVECPVPEPGEVDADRVLIGVRTHWRTEAEAWAALIEGCEAALLEARARFAEANRVYGRAAMALGEAAIDLAEARRAYRHRRRKTDPQPSGATAGGRHG